MEKFIVLYNPISGNGQIDTAEVKLPEGEAEFFNVTEIPSYAEFFKGVKKDVNVVIAGGDGTLNRFINETAELKLKNKIYYFAAGNGNDFWTDIGRKKGDEAICIDKYLENLPEVTVNGKNYKFINGVGYGIDGYCCEVGDKLKAQNKKVNYTAIAIKGLLFWFKPRKATVTVDGVTKEFKKCWIAPAMNGRYYGGGMMPTPAQDRLDPEHKVSVCLMYGHGKLKTLMAFPKIFTGEHVKKKKMVQILSGKKINVKFAKPCALQIDGETILNVSEYTVTAADEVILEQAA